MANVSLFKQDGTQNGTVELNADIFGIEPNNDVVFEAVVMQRASMRQGTHAVKNRSAVRGGGKTMASKGYWTCSSRFNSFTTMAWRRNCLRTYSSFIRIQHSKENASLSIEVSTFTKGIG